MLIVAIKLKPGVDGAKLDSFLKKWIPVLREPRRIGALSSLQMYSSSHTGTRMDEFVLMIDGFVQAPPLDDLENLCNVVYSFDCEETFSWTSGS